MPLLSMNTYKTEKRTLSKHMLKQAVHKQSAKYYTQVLPHAAKYKLPSCQTAPRPIASGHKPTEHKAVSVIHCPYIWQSLVPIDIPGYSRLVIVL